MPVVDFAGGRVSFRRTYDAPNPGPVPDGESAGRAECAVVSQAIPLHDDYVSLASQNIRICAAEFELIEKGAIRRIGWVNVINESWRSYVYEGDLWVTESIDELPTWDGQANERRPFYFGQYWSTNKADNKDEGCIDILEEGNTEDLMFNDNPCMPPSYGVFEENNIPLGKFNISPEGCRPTLMTRVRGRDSYVACLVLFDEADRYRVAWHVCWDVTFEAQVVGDERGMPVVRLADTALTRLNTGDAVDATALVGQVLNKNPGATMKVYEANKDIPRVPL